MSNWLGIMRIIYTLGLLIGVPLALGVGCILSAMFEDRMIARFGKPPIWLVLINVAIWVAIFAQIAWEQAGKWAKP